MDINSVDFKNNEKKMIFHLVIIMVYSFMALVLCAETVLMGWELWTVPALLSSVIAVWWIYIKQALNVKARLYIYLIMMLIALFYYGVHETSLFDVPLILVLVMMLFVLVEENFIIYFFYVDYILIICWHVLVTKAINLSFTALEWSRLLMNFAVIIIGGLVFRYTIHSRRRDRQNYLEVIGIMEETNKRSEDFLTNVSHELRTPINAVTGITAVMQEEEADENKRRNLSAVQRAGRRLSDQIGDILDYTELDTGRLKVSRSNYMISSLIYDLSAELGFMWQDSDNELVINIDPNLPAGLIGDAAKISKIIRHLADNALKFTKEGGVYVKIYGMKREYGINLCIQVKDTGIGISREQLERLTDHFYQADAGRARRVGGIGLGLAVVQGLVMRMDGFMHIESEEGTGTTVHVSIPQGISDPDPCMSVEDTDEICVGCFLYPDRYSVPTVRDYYNEMIRQLGDGLGIRVHYCISLEELKKVMKRYRFTHLFLGRGEYEECREFLASYESALHVAVSVGRDDEPVADKSVKILKKPFTVFSILQILNERQVANLKEEAKPYLPGVRSLVVDDDSMNLIVARGILGMYGMKVDIAGGGAEAIEMCSQKDYDIIFMDHMMPEMDGIEAAHRIRNILRSEYHTKIVALTANAVSGAREMFLSEGFDEFLAKPIEPLILERALKRLLPAAAFVQHETTGEEIKEAGDESVSDVYEIKADMNAIASKQEKAAGRSATEKLNEAGFDTQQALVYCGNDEGFYEEMLRTFVSEAPDKKASLRKFFDEEDIDNYRIAVHALKSGSRTIGAMQLSGQALALEDAAKNNDIDYIRANHDLLNVTFDGTVDMIVAAMPEKQAEDKPVADAAEGEWESLLSDLRAAIDGFDSDAAAEIMEKAQTLTHESVPCTEILKNVFAALRDYDFIAAGEALDEIGGE
ncbi:MAG: response regulator [Lachnospiraceae bacterium]|nr:response regulator [Lachnospiraceae bacterium]